MAKKFKKVRLFKISKELNVSVDTLVHHLEAEGYAEALSGSGLNASVQDEDAYHELLEAFAADKEVAARVKEKRAARAAELREDHEEEPVAVAEPEEEESPEVETAEPVEVEVEQPIAEVEPEQTEPVATAEIAEVEPEETEAADPEVVEE